MFDAFARADLVGVKPESNISNDTRASDSARIWQVGAVASPCEPLH